jgi:hypothetical protein
MKIKKGDKVIVKPHDVWGFHTSPNGGLFEGGMYEVIETDKDGNIKVDSVNWFWNKNIFRRAKKNEL